MQKNWYESKKNLQELQYINFRLKNDLSSGINTLPILDIYRHYNDIESMEGQYITQYVNMELPVLNEAVKFYEKMTALGSMDNASNYADHCCITAGATSAITALFEYIYCTRPNASFLFLGYQYFLFGFLAKKYDLKYKTLISSVSNKNAPSICEIEQELESKSYDYILLTHPFNPSGEIFEKEEIVQLLSLVKRRSISLIIDKCQCDEAFISMHTDFYNIGQIITEHKAEESIVVIHSFSKIRSIPGVRFGYVLGKKDMVDFVKYFCEMHYGMNGLTYIVSILIDLFFQTILICKHIPVLTLKKTFRHMIMICFEQGIARNIIFKLMSSDDFEIKLKNYTEQLLKHNTTMHNNFTTIKSVFEQNPYVDFTTMRSSYNFLLLYSNPYQITEKKFQELIAAQLNSIIFTQRNFCATNQMNTICMRLSCADINGEYLSKITKLNEMLFEKIK